MIMIYTIHDPLQGLQRNIKLKDATGKELSASLVFSEAIKFLHDDMVTTMTQSVMGVTKKDVHWVLTVPAIWNDVAKQFMREAAEKVLKLLNV